MSHPDSQKLACLGCLAAVVQLKGDPTPREFEAFLAAMSTFQPIPSGITPEKLLMAPPAIDDLLFQIQDPQLQQQLYQGAYTIVRSQGINPQEAELLAKMQAAFQLSPEEVADLTKRPLAPPQSDSIISSALAGVALLIGREGEVRRLIMDYCLGTAIVGLVPITGGGSLEIKLLIVLALILKMIWDIRRLWGKPRGQDILAYIGNIFGFLAAVVAGCLAWVTLVALGVVIPYASAFAKAAGFATSTWVAGQSTNQFYTSQKRPDLAALRRAFPNLLPSDR